MNTFNKRKKKLPTRCHGFTLIEMLIVVGILSVMSLVIFKSIANGLEIWERSQKFAQEEDLAIALDKMGQDLRNAFDFSQISFEGRELSVAVPTVVKMVVNRGSSEDDSGYVHQLGKVEYYFDKLRGRLYRREANYSQALDGSYMDDRLLIDSVHSLKFTYYYLKNDDNESEILSHGKEHLPAAILLEMKLLEHSGKKRPIRRLFNIPYGAYYDKGLDKT